MSSNINLDIDAGATIEFPVAPLPFTKSRYLGVETLAPMPLIGGHDMENVTVTGRGILTTSDYEIWRKDIHSYIDTGDDGIVLKAGKDADGLRVNRPTEHVTITNCTVHHAHGAVVIGSETAGSIRNVVASNITAVDTENRIRIKSRRGRGGVVEDAPFDNWTMENVGVGVVVRSYYIMGGETATKEEPVSERTPVFRNIAISNVTMMSP